ncbi:helix-turn-helix transcriptional regulator [Variovorax ginsengisoli]|uniref:AraC-like DNA-binding protein n=1 Tax=Variovorax ginsengisoli TaxID=363844 RepID=A0ABT9S9P7_9BURK|nr:helix-turn-helix domain-containing protein [Variovorax ginsengisoli]MDP9900935.1 AraC-like DNA-binding protein [Variovorax ginsengisoli]
MQIQIDSSELHSSRACPAAVAERMMWLNADRVLYVGLLGAPSVRTFGAFCIYVSLHSPHRICVEGGEWEEAQLSVVPPYVGHRIETRDRMICNILIESETVRLQDLPEHIRSGRGAVHDVRALATMRLALDRFRRCATRQYARTEDFDENFFGSALPARSIDKRMGAVVDKIKCDPNSHTSAEECAVACHLSVSRFLHLFKAEVGSPFRSFRTWQRARSVLYYVTQNTNLTNIALDVGYPDATHFSHSIRQIYGLTPKSIFAGCRRLALYGSGTAASARSGFN